MVPGQIGCRMVLLVAGAIVAGQLAGHQPAESGFPCGGKLVAPGHHMAHGVRAGRYGLGGHPPAHRLIGTEFDADIGTTTGLVRDVGDIPIEAQGANRGDRPGAGQQRQQIMVRLTAGLLAVATEPSHVGDPSRGQGDHLCPLQQAIYGAVLIHYQSIIVSQGSGIVSNLAVLGKPLLLAIVGGRHGKVEPEGLGKILGAGEPRLQGQTGDIAVGGEQQAPCSPLHAQTAGKPGYGLPDHRLEDPVEVKA